MQSRHISVVIDKTAGEVYDYVSDPENLPLWAAGLAQSEVARAGDTLLVDSPMGAVKVTFAPRNPFGVLDHDVVLPSGDAVSNPLRVVNHPEGAEVIFTVRQLGDEASFERDASTVFADLERIKGILEDQEAAGTDLPG